MEFPSGDHAGSRSHHVGGIGQVADVAFLGRRGEDFAARSEDGTRASGRDVGRTNASGFNLLEVRTHFRQVAGQVDFNVVVLVRLEIKQVQRPELLEEGAGGFDVGVHVGEHELDGLEFGDGFAEGFAGAGDSTDSSRAAWARPTACAAMPMRPPSRAERAIFKPWPSSPRRLAAGTSQLSRMISTEGELRWPIFLRDGRCGSRGRWVRRGRR